MPKRIDIESLLPIVGTLYPPPYDEPCRERMRIRLADVAELTQFGVNRVDLAPGAWSSHRHYHTLSEEFVYVLAGEARDYYYPNIAPRMTDPYDNVAPTCDGDFDETWIPSTLWYHDHAMDVTGFNVSRGLAGFYLVFDDREIEMITGTGSGAMWVPPVLPPPGREAR